MKNCCSGSMSGFQNEPDYEVIKIRKTKAVCDQCEKASESKAEKGVPLAIISCEGACLKGEISRRVANNICFKDIPEKTFRVCLGGAFTKDTNQRKIVRNSQKVIALEGCTIMCASRMIKGVLPDTCIQTILVNRYYDIDNNLFAINDLPEHETAYLADTATKKILEVLKNLSEINKNENSQNYGC